MKTRINKIIVFLLCVIIIISAFSSLPVSAESYGRVIDEANLFTNEEILNIKDAITSISGAKIYIITTNDKFFTESKLKSMISTENSIALTINMNTRKYDIYAYGKADRNLTDKEIGRLESAVEGKLSDEKYEKAALTFIKKAGIAYSGELKADLGFVILVSLGISVVIALITCSIVIAKYKMKMRATNYPLDKYARMKLNDKQDIFMGKIVTTRRIQTNTSSGGGKSGGGGGGGGHRGGGSF